MTILNKLRQWFGRGERTKVFARKVRVMYRRCITFDDWSVTDGIEYQDGTVFAGGFLLLPHGRIAGRWGRNLWFYLEEQETP